MQISAVADSCALVGLIIPWCHRRGPCVLFPWQSINLNLLINFTNINDETYKSEIIVFWWAAQVQTMLGGNMTSSPPFQTDKIESWSRVGLALPDRPEVALLRSEGTTPRTPLWLRPLVYPERMCMWWQSRFQLDRVWKQTDGVRKTVLCSSNLK